MGVGSWSIGCCPNKQESHSDAIGKVLPTYVTLVLAVMPKLTRILVNMDLVLLGVARGKVTWEHLLLNCLMKD